MADEVVSSEETSEETVETLETTDPEPETSVEAEETEPEVEDDDDDLTEEDTKIAKSLLKNLRNPEKGRQTAEELAKAFGVKFETDKKGETTVVDKKTGEEVDIAKLVNDNLPVGWEKMGPVMIKILEAYEENRIAPKINKSQEEKHNERSDNAYSYLKGKYKDAEAMGPAMAEIAATVAPARLNTQADYNTYIEYIYKLAKGAGGQAVNDTVLQVLKKTVKNAKRAKPGPSDVTRVKQDIKVKTTDDAISLAMKEMAAKSRK